MGDQRAGGNDHAAVEGGQRGEGVEVLVRGGEDTFLELKVKLSNPEKIAQEIVALANTGGGVIVFGVNELFAALITERCASIAVGVPLDHAANRTMDSPLQTGSEIATAIRTAFPVPTPHV